MVWLYFLKGVVVLLAVVSPEHPTRGSHSDERLRSYGTDSIGGREWAIDLALADVEAYTCGHC